MPSIQELKETMQNNNLDPALQEELLVRIKLLDKVKEFFLRPKDYMRTLSQVAFFYEVSEDALYKCLALNREEIAADGIAVLRGETYEVLHRKWTEHSLGFFVFDDKNWPQCSPQNNNMLFSKRAILHMGMLLQGSPVAHELRAQVLNVTNLA